MATFYRKSDLPDHLQKYFSPAEIGLESTPVEYVARLVEVFEAVRRVLRPDGTLWINIGDCYTSGGRTKRALDTKLPARVMSSRPPTPPRLKPKDLLGIPWRVAFALQDAGWYLRAEIIWEKASPMPESVTDRPTKAHEQVFLLSRSPRYYYDYEAIAEVATGRAPGNRTPVGAIAYEQGDDHHRTKGGLASIGAVETRNARSVWKIASEPYLGAHFAVMPTELARRCILAGTSAHGACASCGAPWRRVRERVADGYGPARWQPSCRCGDDRVVPCTVLDPFAGAGTVPLVAVRNGRSAIGIEINPEYAEMARRRIVDDAPLLALGG